VQEIGLNERQIKAVYYVKEKEFITNSIYQELCNTSERTASKDLENLTGLNVLNKTGEKKGTRYQLKHGG
jgi:ATP-dependent DNA helicase RecG